MKAESINRNLPREVEFPDSISAEGAFILLSKGQLTVWLNSDGREVLRIIDDQALSLSGTWKRPWYRRFFFWQK